MSTIKITEDEFGLTKQPSTLEIQPVKRFTFSNSNGVSVQVITYGATITSINVPDRNGNLADICLGFDTMEGYLSSVNPYFGATIGRVCNRIGGAQFYLNGQEYKLAKNNNGRIHLHGGFIGFDKFNWTPIVKGNTVIMTHVNNDGFEGYPGVVIANVTFELKEDNEFSIKFEANTSKATPINLTNHAYFNLAGHETGHEELYKHSIRLNADRITVTDPINIIPTGELKSVSGTPFDLRIQQELGPAMKNVDGTGYDDNFCVVKNGCEGLNFIAEVIHKESGRSLEVYCDQPGVQLYTGNFLPDPKNNIYPSGKSKLPEAPNSGDAILGKNGARYMKHGAFCLETQKYPDSVNHDNFPSTIVSPTETYRHTVLYRLNTEPIIEMVPLKM